MPEKAVETRRKEKENLEKKRRVVLMCQLVELNINVTINILQMDPKTKPIKQLSSFFYFNTLYRASVTILYSEQQMHNYFTNYLTATCFDTMVSS